MKILHLATSLEGGAGLSALKLHRLLRSSGEDSNLISRSHVPLDEGILENHTSKSKLILSKANTLINSNISKREYGFVSPVSVSTIDLQQIYSLAPDIIHIHNWYNLVSFQNLCKLSNDFSVVITAHDFRIGSGACHVSLDCQNFKNSCNKCPALKVLKRSAVKSKYDLENLFKSVASLRVIVPSKWIGHQLEMSLKIDQSRITNIQNILDSQTSNHRKNSYSVKPDKFLFISAEINSPFKGLVLLISALNHLQEANKLSKDFSLTVVGNGDTQFTRNAKFKIIHAGKLQVSETLALMTKHDVLVVPSISDNRPSVVLEAQKVGLPVLATHVGGIPEMIIHGQTGLLVEPLVTELANALYFLNGVELERCARFAQKAITADKSESAILQEHIKLYSQMMRES